VKKRHATDTTRSAQRAIKFASAPKSFDAVHLTLSVVLGSGPRTYARTDVIEVVSRCALSVDLSGDLRSCANSCCRGQQLLQTK
jgi:hypothetical protein